MIYPVRIDEHTRAFDWLQKNLKENIYTFDINDTMAMIEQVLAE